MRSPTDGERVESLAQSPSPAAGAARTAGAVVPGTGRCPADSDWHGHVPPVARASRLARRRAPPEPGVGHARRTARRDARRTALGWTLRTCRRCRDRNARGGVEKLGGTCFGEHFEQYGIVTRSPRMAGVIRRIELLSATRSTVLITGETGTGKELVARAVHTRSAQRN